MSLEAYASRSAQWQDGLPLFPPVETPGRLGAGNDGIAPTSTPQSRPRGRTQCRQHPQPIDQNQCHTWKRARLRHWGKIWGRKRHLLVDTQGFVLAVKVHSAGISDRNRKGVKQLLADLQASFPRIRHLFADHSYTDSLIDWIKERLTWKTDKIKRERGEHNDTREGKRDVSRKGGYGNRTVSF
jgi:hypothetical protein